MIAISGWIMAVLIAGTLGWLGRPVLVLLPDSPDARPDAPSFAVIGRARHLNLWLAGSAIVMALVIALRLPLELVPAWLVVCGVGTWLAYIDWRTHLLPRLIVMPLYAVALLVVGAEAWLALNRWILLRGVLCSAVGFALFWCMWWLADRREHGSFGFGDVRFSAPLGLVLGSVGWTAAFTGLFLALVFGTVAGAILKWRRADSAFAFGPWMLLGAVVGAAVS